MKKLFFAILISAIAFSSVKIYSQDNINSRVSENKPNSTEEKLMNNTENYLQNYLNDEINNLEKKHKQALKNGNSADAEEIERQILSYIPAENKITTNTDKQNSMGFTEIKKDIQEPGDWLSSNSIVYYDVPKASELFHKQIETKLGEDNNLYAVVNGVHSGSTFGQFYISKSTDLGLTWNYVVGVGHNAYIRNVTMLVESKQNANPDSTRIIVFYTLSNSDDYYTGSTLRYYSVRTNGTASSTGIIAFSPMGKTYSHLSAVSDGAFWESPTYYGVVLSESDGYGDTYQTKFFRTANWGTNWVSSDINTGLNDLYPSAEYKEGTLDSVYIAVERKFSETNKEVRVLATPWFPAAVFHTYYLTNNATNVYEKPTLTVKQDGNADSILITCTKKGQPVYHFTPNGGATWNLDFSLGGSNGSNKAFTFCSSARSGAAPFSACWVSSDGDSVNVRRGVLGFMGTTVYKVNTNISLYTTMPVCVNIPFPNKNTTLVTYSSTPSFVFSTQEGLKTVNVKMIPQGFYNPNTNQLNSSDSVKLIVRNLISPYNKIDSAKSLLSAVTLSADFLFSGLNDGQYYLSVEHRNSIETWGSQAANLIITGNNDYNFTVSASTAYGNNMIQVDNNPVKFAIYSGDVNQDGVVDATDAGAIDNHAANFITGYVNTDLTGDYVVDATDAALCDNNAFNFVSKVIP